MGRNTISFFLRDGDEWIPDAIDEMRRELEDAGIKISRQGLVRKCVEKTFAKYRKDSYRKRPPPPPQEKVTSIKVTFPPELGWLSNALVKVVNMKRQLGIDPDTTVERELLRWAVNGYKNARVGSDLDKIILESEDDTIT